MYRSQFNLVLARLAESRRFIQVLAGPRQVGKTTLVRQVLEHSPVPYHYASADEPVINTTVWLAQPRSWTTTSAGARTSAML